MVDDIKGQIEKDIKEKKDNALRSETEEERIRINREINERDKQERADQRKNRFRSLFKKTSGRVSAGTNFMKRRFSKEEEKGSSEIRRGDIVWVLIAALLYLSDIFVTRFDGFSYKVFRTVMWPMFSSYESVFKWVLNVGIIAIVVGYWIFKKPDKREFISFFILVELIWLITTIGGLNIGHLGIILHLAFAISALIWLVYPAFGDSAQANFLIASMIFIDFFLFSLVAELAPNLPYFNRLIIPIWFFFTLALTKQSKWKSILIFIIIMFYVFNAFNVVTEFRQGGMDALSSQEIQNAKEYVQTTWNNMKTFVSSFVTRQKQWAMGEYYTGEIDESAQKKLGVYFLDIYPSQTKPYKNGERITVFADIEADTLKTPIDISLTCKAGSNYGEITPSSISVSDYDQETVDCNFKQGLSSDSEVKIIASANLETSAYRQGYFASSTDFESKERPEEYLTRKNVFYKSSSTVLPGALNIGVEVGSKVTKIDKDHRNIRFIVDFSLMPGWKGQIQKINQVVIQMRNNFELSEEVVGSGRHCNGLEFEEMSCSELNEANCDDSLYNLYKLDAENLDMGDIGLGGVERLSCRIDVVNIDNFFPDPTIMFSIHTFRVIADYDYEMEKAIGIKVEEREVVT